MKPWLMIAALVLHNSYTGYPLHYSLPLITLAAKGLKQGIEVTVDVRIG